MSEIPSIKMSFYLNKNQQNLSTFTIALIFLMGKNCVIFIWIKIRLIILIMCLHIAVYWQEIFIWIKIQISMQIILTQTKIMHVISMKY